MTRAIPLGPLRVLEFGASKLYVKLWQLRPAEAQVMDSLSHGIGQYLLRLAVLHAYRVGCSVRRWAGDLRVNSIRGIHGTRFQ